MIEATGYTLGGGGVAADDPLCVAKRTLDTYSGNPTYWVKRATAGSMAGMLFNQFDPNFQPESLRREWSHSGKPAWEWAKVSEEAFEAYLRFQRSGHEVHLRHATRL